MAWTVKLTDGTTTFDMNDSVNSFLNPNGFYAPPPPRRTSLTGGNLFRHGADILESVYDNRIVTVNFALKGTSGSTIAQSVQDIWSLLRKAEEWSKSGIGTQVQLQYQWEGADGPVYFNALQGSLDLGRDLHSSYLSKGTRLRSAELSLLCEPFAVGAAETVENYVKDPSFEVAATPLADWTQATGGLASGTILRTTGQAKWGTASVELAGSSVDAGTAFARVTQVVSTAVASGATWSASVWHRLISVANFRAEMTLQFSNATGSNVGVATSTATGTAFAQMTIATATATSSGTLTFRMSLTGISGTGSGTVRFDNAYVGSGSGTLPTAWAAGRDVANHFDDNGQAHINYIDIYNVQGDVSAPLQIKATEKEAHTKIWVGARHASRLGNTLTYIEGESLSGTSSASADATASNGTAALRALGSGTGSSAGTPVKMTANLSPPPQGLFRVLARAFDPFGTATAFMAVGWSYGAGSIISDPTATANYAAVLPKSQYAMLDMGVLTIPPIETPQGGTIGTFDIRVAAYVADQTLTATANLRIDYLVLLPVDQGMIYGTKGSQADVAWIDSRSKPAGLYLMSTAGSLRANPINQVGAAPEAHPLGSRYYFVFDDGASAGIALGATVSLTYVPRFLQVD